MKYKTRGDKLFFPKQRVYLVFVLCFVLLVACFLVVSVFSVSAQQPADQQGEPQPGELEKLTKTFLGEAGYTVEGGGYDIRYYAVRIIKMTLSVTGFLFFILIFYGGYLWMTAGGNEEVLKKSKAILSKAVIGFVIVLASYSITYFIGEYVRQAVVPEEAFPKPEKTMIESLIE